MALNVSSLVRVPVERAARGTSLTVAMAFESRVWTDDEVRLVENVAALVRTTLESARIQQRERNIAQQLQIALQPVPPDNLPGLALQGFYRPALAEAGVGGDFYDVFALDKGCTALVVGDLSGKGLAAASEVATVRNMVRYALYSSSTVADAIAGVDHVLAERNLLRGFSTLFVGVYDAAARSLTYVNCGQEPGLLWRKANGEINYLLPTGAVLGGFESDQKYEQETVLLASGDVLALFTDGLTEVGPSRKEQLEIEGVCSVLRACCADGVREPKTALECLIAGVDDFARGGVRDDIALLVGVAE